MCGKCPVSFETGKQLVQHMRTHEGNLVAAPTPVPVKKQNEAATSPMQVPPASNSLKPLIGRSDSGVLPKCTKV